jgi:hypothetical protein
LKLTAHCTSSYDDEISNLLLVTLVLAAKGIELSDDECEIKQGIYNDGNNCTADLDGSSYATVTEASY